MVALFRDGGGQAGAQCGSSAVRAEWAASRDGAQAQARRQRTSRLGGQRQRASVHHRPQSPGAQGPVRGYARAKKLAKRGQGSHLPPRMTATRLHQDTETSEASCATFLSGWTSWGAAVALLEAVGPAVVLALAR